MSCDLSEELIKKVCKLSMEAHECFDESNQYLYEECQLSSQAAAVFSFPGAWLASDWFSGTSCYGETKIDLALFPSLQRIGWQEPALVNEAFLCRFQAIFRNSSLAVEVDEAVKEGKQVVFAGHSSGGPMVIFTTLWFLEKFTNTKIDCIAAPRCVTFGSPFVGNHSFPHAITRDNWSHYFVHFVMTYDIVPRIMFAPPIESELQQVLDFLNPRSILHNHSSISMSKEASSFVENVLTNLSSVASYVAYLLVENFSSFMELSVRKNGI